jgi:tRNA(Ile)-lysidine synthase
VSGVRVPAPPPNLRRLPARLRRIEPALRRALRGPCALPRGSRILVAVSGGADSTALLVGIARVAPEHGLAVSAAHLHHGLRGAAADADLEHVRALCGRLGVPLAFARRDTPRQMRRRGLAGENGLRILRRAFLRRAATRAGAQAIATAHTADDQLETLLMRLARGAGLRGLGGMRERHGRWLKPMLDVTRAEVEADLGRAGIAWRTDESNADRRYLRNRVRHDVVPALLAAIAPARPSGSARAALARRAGAAAREAREAERAIAAWISPVLGKICRIQRGEIALETIGVAPYPIAARRTLLRQLWRALPGAGPGLTVRHLETLDRLIAAGREGAAVNLPDAWTARREGGWIRFHRSRPRTLEMK